MLGWLVLIETAVTLVWPGSSCFNCFYTRHTQSASISSETERCNNVTESISRAEGLRPVTIPSTPAKGPDVILPGFPACQKEQGCISNPASTARRSDSI